MRGSVHLCGYFSEVDTRIPVFGASESSFFCSFSWVSDFPFISSCGLECYGWEGVRVFKKENDERRVGWFHQCSCLRECAALACLRECAALAGKKSCGEVLTLKGGYS